MAGREYIFENEYAWAKVHRTDDLWFMYLTDWSQEDEQYTFDTLKTCRLMFAHHADRLRHKNDPTLKACGRERVNG